MTRLIEESQYTNTKLRDTTIKGLSQGSFLPSDLVCRKLEAVRPTEAREALAPKWEEPVQISQAFGNRAYKLKTLDGKLIPRTWNVDNLRKFYE